MPTVASPGSDERCAGGSIRELSYRYVTHQLTQEFAPSQHGLDEAHEYVENSEPEDEEDTLFQCARAGVKPKPGSKALMNKHHRAMTR